MPRVPHASCPPRLSRVARNLVPKDALHVLHRNEVQLAVAIHIGSSVVVGGNRAIGKSLEWLLPRVSWIAIPGPARTVIDPAIAVDVEGRAANIGRRFIADQVSLPIVGGSVFPPPDFTPPLPREEIQISVAVDIHQRGLAKLLASLTNFVQYER